MNVDINRIQLEMARQILTLEDLTAKSGLSHYGLRKILTGKSDPTPASIGKLAKSLGLDPEQIIKSE